MPSLLAMGAEVATTTPVRSFYCVAVGVAAEARLPRYSQYRTASAAATAPTTAQTRGRRQKAAGAAPPVAAADGCADDGDAAEAVEEKCLPLKLLGTRVTAVALPDRRTAAIAVALRAG